MLIPICSSLLESTGMLLVSSPPPCLLPACSNLACILLAHALLTPWWFQLTDSSCWELLLQDKALAEKRKYWSESTSLQWDGGDPFLHALGNGVLKCPAYGLLRSTPCGLGQTNRAILSGNGSSTARAMAGLVVAWSLPWLLADPQGLTCFWALLSPPFFPSLLGLVLMQPPILLPSLLAGRTALAFGQW